MQEQHEDCLGLMKTEEVHEWNTWSTASLIGSWALKHTQAHSHGHV